MSRVDIGPLVLDVEQLRSGRYAVRPDGQLGTCGDHPYTWTVIMVRATDPITAARKAFPKVQLQRTVSRSIAEGSPVIEEIKP